MKRPLHTARARLLRAGITQARWELAHGHASPERCDFIAELCGARNDYAIAYREYYERHRP